MVTKRSHGAPDKFDNTCFSLILTKKGPRPIHFPFLLASSEVHKFKISEQFTPQIH